MMRAPFARIRLPLSHLVSPLLRYVRPSSNLGPRLWMKPTAPDSSAVSPVPDMVPTVQKNVPVTRSVPAPSSVLPLSTKLWAVTSPLPESVPPDKLKGPLTSDGLDNDKEPPDRSRLARLWKLLIESLPTGCRTVIPTTLMKAFCVAVGSALVLQFSGVSQRKSPASPSQN